MSQDVEDISGTHDKRQEVSQDVSIQAAFAVLLADIETALLENLERRKIASSKGEDEVNEVELERESNLISIRNQLEVLQEVWEEIVGERTVAEVEEQKQSPAETEELSQPLDEVEEEAQAPAESDDPTPPPNYGDILLASYKKIQESAAETWEEFNTGRRLTEVIGQAGRRITTMWGSLDLQSLRSQAKPKEDGTVKPEAEASPETSKSESSESGINSALQEKAAGVGNWPVFVVYQQQWYAAILFSNHQLHFRGKMYDNPSEAAMAITGSKINGWKFWRYLDAQGQEQFIDALRAGEESPTDFFPFSGRGEGPR